MGHLVERRCPKVQLHCRVVQYMKENGKGKLEKARENKSGLMDQNMRASG